MHLLRRGRGGLQPDDGLHRAGERRADGLRKQQLPFALLPEASRRGRCCQYGEHKYTHRAAGRGLAADLDLGSFSSLEDLNACVLANRTTAAALPSCDPLRESQCPDCAHVRGQQLSSACAASGGNRSLLGNCTATCCDEDIRAYYRTSRERQGAAVALTGWSAYDHRLRPWYIQGKANWDAQRQRHAWSDVYEFATSSQPGITATAAAVNSSGGLLGFLTSDYELTEINKLLAESLEDADKWGLEGRVWAYVVEASNGKLLGVAPAEPLFDASADRSEELLDRRLSAVDSSHESVAASGRLLQRQGWPSGLSGEETFDDSEDRRFYFATVNQTDKYRQLEWLLVAGVDIECPGAFQHWDSGSGQCRTDLELILVLVGILPVLCSLGWFCDARRIISVKNRSTHRRLLLATKNFEKQNQRALKDQKRRLDAMKADVSYPPTWTENEDDKILVPVSPTSAEFWDVHDKLRAPPVEVFADVCPKSGKRSKLTGTRTTFSCLVLTVLSCRSRE